MRHQRAWWAAGVVAAAAIGCGPGKELPGADEVPHPADTAGPPVDPNGPAPAASEAAARAVLDDAVKAVTRGAGGPDRLARARVSRAARAGKFQSNQPDLSRATCRFEAAWPDRGHAEYDLDQVKMTGRFRNRLGWFTQGLVTQNRNPSDVGRICRTDFHAQHWIPLGLTLADVKTVAWGRTPIAGGTAVKVAAPDSPDLPVFLVTFDDKTGLPVRVEYHPDEGAGRVHKVYVMSDHKVYGAPPGDPAGGYLLPGETKLTQNGRLAEHWTTNTWEFPEKLDESLFDPPK